MAQEIKLNDLLRRNLRIVICGTAAGKVSAEKKQYYAGQGNRFWETLFEIGLTDKILQPNEYRKLLTYGIGLTDLVKDESGMDKDIYFGEKNRKELFDRIKKYQPTVLCFNGKRAAREYLLRKVDYGPQEDLIGSTKIFVTPSTSRAANRFWNIGYYRQLVNFAK